MTDLVGRVVLGRYRIVRKLAKGGMGIVYLARAEGSAGFIKPVVVKRILPDLSDDDSLTKLFVREARILSNLHHSGIVQVIDFGEEDGAYVMVLEYVHGYHLGKWAKFAQKTRGLLPVEVALHVVLQVLDALHYAHSLKRPDGKALHIVHRDISPSNILVGIDGQVKLVDFGVARAQGDGTFYKTEDYSVKGKLPYLAPELLNGVEPSVRSDVYACGVVLHELLTGRNEFRAGEMAETLNRVMHHSPVSVHTARDDAPDWIDDVVFRAMAKRPEDRYASCAEFAKALREMRGLSMEEAAAQFAALVREDFEGGISDAEGLESLAVLDTAWRHGVAAERADPSLPRISRPPSEPPTVAASPMAFESQGRPAVTVPAEPSRRVLTWPWAVVLVLLAAGAAAAAVVVVGQTQDQPAAPAPIVVVEREREADPIGDPEQGTAPDPGTTPDPVPAPDPDPGTGAGSGGTGAVRPPTKAPSKAPTTDSLTRAFTRRRGQIEGCFREHASQVQGQPQITVRFTLAANGNVDAAELVPDALGGTPLGGCILRVARGTRFDPPGEPISFRIPITARAD